MTDTSTPQGTDLYTAQNAIRAMLSPEGDNVAGNDALEADTTEDVAEAEMPLMAPKAIWTTRNTTTATTAPPLICHRL